MTAPTPKPGERWRVTIEGTVEDNTGTWVYLRAGDGDDYTLPTWGVGVSLERLPDPEPEWQPGDLVIDANGVYWERFVPVVQYQQSWVWGRPGNSEPGTLHEAPVRPLRRLVPEVRA